VLGQLHIEKKVKPRDSAQLGTNATFTRATKAAARQKQKQKQQMLQL